jgi:hypothetical protein
MPRNTGRRAALPLSGPGPARHSPRRAPPRPTPHPNRDMLRSNFTTLFGGLAALALGAPLFGQELIVGGPDSLIRRSNPAQGPFTVIGACGGVVDSMVAHGDTTYIGDVTGRIYVHRPSTGIGYAFDAANDATALAVHSGNLLVAGSNGTVLRYNVATGALISSLPATIPIHAMLRVGNHLFIGSHFGVVQRADLSTGGPFSFWGTCGGPIDALATDGTALILGTTSGVVYRIGLVDQQVYTNFTVGDDIAALGMNLGHLLVADSTGRLRRVDAVTGAVHTELHVGSAVAALALTDGTPPGSTYCYGIACPCGNDDALHGCRNSLGRGAHLQATGTASVTADDLTLVVTHSPSSTFGIFYMGLGSGTSTIGDGIFCTGGAGGYGNYRYPVVQASPGGTFTMSGFAAHANQHFDALGSIQAGRSWHFQIWYRDPAGPCGHAFNTSNGFQVTFTP